MTIIKSQQAQKMIIVGLGNPGAKYHFTPHNIGWMVVDTLAAECAISLRQKKSFSAQTTSLADQSVILMKPLTYMNLSGRAVKEAMEYYRLQLNQLLVVHDDLDLPFLSMKFQKNRGAAGHNGLRNINQELGSQNYLRLRIGVSRAHSQSVKKSDIDDSADVSSFNIMSLFLPHIQSSKPSVLKSFSKADRKKLSYFLGDCVTAVKYCLSDGWEKAANRYNTSPSIS